jgi:[acyl-carrier-protein] S-malonyltransferase
MTFEQALKLVRRRGELMQQAAEAHPGTMAAIIGLPADKVKEVVKDCQQFGIVDAANFNTPEQTVISGEVEAVKHACEAALAKGAKRAIELKVSGAFHSRLMADAAAGMEDELEKATIVDPKVGVVANVTADFVYTAGEIRQALARQVAGSVRWEECIRRIIAEGVDEFIELGSGTVLAGMIRKIDRGVPVVSISDSSSVRECATKAEY